MKTWMLTLLIICLAALAGAIHTVEPAQAIMVRPDCMTDEYPPGGPRLCCMRCRDNPKFGECFGKCMDLYDE